MIKKLIEARRALWGSTLGIYLLLATAAVVVSGPLTWTIRAETGSQAGSAAVGVGIAVAFLLLGVFFAALSYRRPPTLVLPAAAAVAGVAAAGQAFLSLQPFWLGFLPLLPAALSVAGILSARNMLRYRDEVKADSKKPKSQRRYSGVDPAKLPASETPDVTLTAGGGVLAVSVAVLATLSVSSLVPWFAPELPPALSADGAVTVGRKNPIEVDILYGINYPHTAAIFGDEDATLEGLVDDGLIRLSTQGVSMPGEESIGVPFRMGQACAFERGGADAEFSFLVSYNQELLSSGGAEDPQELVYTAGEDLGEDWRTCVQSGRYELSAGKSLEDSSQYAEAGIPQIYINGEQVEPDSLEELVEMIDEAAGR